MSFLFFACVLIDGAWEGGEFRHSDCLKKVSIHVFMNLFFCCSIHVFMWASLICLIIMHLFMHEILIYSVCLRSILTHSASIHSFIYLCLEDTNCALRVLSPEPSQGLAQSKCWMKGWMNAGMLESERVEFRRDNNILNFSLSPTRWQQLPWSNFNVWHSDTYFH